MSWWVWEVGIPLGRQQGNHHPLLVLLTMRVEELEE
jgi:hypothetical protein